MLVVILLFSYRVADMQFSDSDLHDAMKISLETLIEIIKSTSDVVTRGNAAINLANLLFEIYDRQHSTLNMDDVFDLEDDYEEEE